MGLDKVLSVFIIIGTLFSLPTNGQNSKIRKVRRTPYQQILAHIHYLQEPKFNFIRDLVVNDLISKNELPKVKEITSIKMAKDKTNNIIIKAIGLDGHKRNIILTGSKLIVKDKIKNVEKSKAVYKLKQPNFIASNLFTRQFKDHINEIKQTCSMLDLSDLLDETEELKDGINDYYSFLVPDTEGSLFAELNENPKAMSLLFTLKKVQRKAILRLMILTKINKKC